MGFSGNVHNVKSVTLSKIRENGGVESNSVLSEKYYVRDIVLELAVGYFSNQIMTYKLTLFSKDRNALKFVQGGERV